MKDAVHMARARGLCLSVTMLLTRVPLAPSYGCYTAGTRADHRQKFLLSLSYCISE